MVTNNIVSGGNEGLRLWNTEIEEYAPPQPGSVISNNTIIGASGAVEIVGRNIEFTGNVIHDSTDGLGIRSSDNCVIADNVIVNCSGGGIAILYSLNLNLSSNEITDGGITLYADSVEQASTHRIGEDNTVNGRPIMYYKNMSGIAISGIMAGQLIVANCTDVQISGLDLSNSYGIHGCFIDRFLVENCRINDSYVGIALQKVTNITITGNTLESNDWGIGVSDSGPVNINGNTLTNNTNAAISLLIHDNVSVTGNIVSGSSSGIALYEWSLSPADKIVGQNTVFNNIYGIDIQGSSSGIAVDQNSVYENEYGIRLFWGANNCTIFGNSISDNAYGICMYGARDNLAYNNRFVNNTLDVDQQYTVGNRWDNGYPDGGNYWSVYVGEDLKSGPGQDQPGYDGIGDTPYNFTTGQDNYPLLPVEPLKTVCTIEGSQGSNGWHISGINATLSASGGRGGLNYTEFRLDGGSWERFAGPIHISSDGVHTLEFRSVDNMSHVEASTTISVKIDTVAPDTSSGKSGNFVWLNASDATSGVGLTMFLVDNGTWTVYSGRLNLTQPGTHRVSYYSVDVAGNTEATESLTIVVEKTEEAGPASFPILLVGGLILVVVAGAMLAVLLFRRRGKKPARDSEK